MSAANLSIAIALATGACTTAGTVTSMDPNSGAPTSAPDAGGSGGDGGGGVVPSGSDGGGGVLPGGDAGGGGGTTGVGPYFTHAMFFDHDVSASPKAATSDAAIAALVGAGGWGTGRMQIDFAIDVLPQGRERPLDVRRCRRAATSKTSPAMRAAAAATAT